MLFTLVFIQQALANIETSNQLQHKNLKKLRVGIAYLPNISTTKTDPLPLFVKRLGEVIDVDMDIRIYPFSRSIEYINENKIDLHIPMIDSTHTLKKNLPYQFSSITLWTVNFVLYTHKDKVINLNQLSELKLYTDRTHVGLFPFKLHPTINIKGAIQMVDKNRIDGLIFADTVVDDIINKLELPNIKRTLFRTYPVKFIITNGQRGHEINKKLSLGIQKLKFSEEMKVLSEKLTFPYIDWQPYLTY